MDRMSTRIPFWLELCSVVLLCFLHAGAEPPSLNEAHYLSKAKHFWDPTWCAGDFFLESADAHEVFYWTFGWVTHFVALPVAAWCGRLTAWSLFACAWCMLVRCLTSQGWAATLSAAVLLYLVQAWHLAGEWLVGGIEAKSLAYPLVIWAVACLVQRRWWLVWPLLGLASSLHILVGGWAVVACLFAWSVRRKEDQLSFIELVCWLFVGGVCALAGLLPALELMTLATPSESLEASRIYSFRRLAHHLIFYRFAWLNIARFVLLVVVWYYLAASFVARTDRMKRFHAVVLGSLVIAGCGVLLDWVTGLLPDLRASIMRYYWFRLSDVMVPVGVAICIVASLNVPQPTYKRIAVWTVLCISFVGIGVSTGTTGCLARATALQQQNWQSLVAVEIDHVEMDEQWLDVCHWIREHVARETMFLTPTHQQTFKWFAQRPEVVTWKDVPQDDAALVAWWERRQEVYLLGNRPWQNAREFANLVREYGITHLVWPQSPHSADRPPGEIIYENKRFFVYRL